ncbi:putative cuticular protein RR-2 family member 7 isoform X1 [Penaeus vannamei]|uniref:Putative cuticular protein RR-2 family member 7 isoform X1 n=1 Tax=Penaeus vannamei TaxID=6689 RepID=A0A423TG19_PENVA|nr:putative cuticular protein RR-2 family member 7 isoform X1 [Penaeus vannamei]ROT75429.1 putative cuticular protein RR-2 family member 7 isoform X1 [Penaeus vannamei]
MLDSRGVEVEQGLQPSPQLFQNHQAFSQAFKERSEEMALQYSLGQVEYNDPNPEYAWAYEVDARSTGDMKSAREERRGDVVVGQYSVMDPDGSLRVVDYSVAPGTGFQATVRKEYAGEAFQGQEQRLQAQARQYSAIQQGTDYQQNRGQYSQNRNQYQENRGQYNFQRYGTNRFNQNLNRPSPSLYSQNQNYLLARYGSGSQNQYTNQYNRVYNQYNSQQNRNQQNQGYSPISVVLASSRN